MQTLNMVGRACYTPATDTINMPNADAFVDTPDATATQSFYSTLLHEHVHWTGHESRLDRLKSKGKFTSDYAYEELIAELGSVILAVQLGWKSSQHQTMPSTSTLG